MSKRRRDPWRRLTSLRMQLAALLSVAVLPLGVVAVMQTAAVVTEAQRLERSDFLARTLRAVHAERELLRHAYGAAEALGTTAAALGSGNPLCTQVMQSFVAENDAAIFAGFIDTDGVLRCSNTTGDVVFSGSTDWSDFVANPRPTVAYNPSGAATGAPVLVVSMPIHDIGSGDFVGVGSVSLPARLFETVSDPEYQGVRIALLDAEGEVLGASVDTEMIAALGLRPADLPISDGGYTQNVVTRTGTPALATIVPLISERIYVLGVWDRASLPIALPLLGTAVPLFPLLMWAAALAVGLMAIDRLVLRHLRRMRSRMSRFSFDNPGHSFAILDRPPQEISDIADTYNRMVDRILGDRTELKDALGEKDLLLREVHHRVKNNLQLIVSMINIQIRAVRDGESRQILRRMQDRIMGLSSIHKALYAGNTLSEVRADRLLQEILQSSLSISLPTGSGVKTELALDTVTLDPDEAVPLTLLANELVTNAIKYVGRSGSDAPFIHVTLKADGPNVCLEVANTLGTAVQSENGSAGTGMGSQLIEAFVAQMGATFEAETKDGVYRVSVLCPNLLGRDANDNHTVASEDTRDVDLREAS